MSQWIFKKKINLYRFFFIIIQFNQNGQSWRKTIVLKKKKSKRMPIRMHITFKQTDIFWYTYTILISYRHSLSFLKSSLNFHVYMYFWHLVKIFKSTILHPPKQDAWWRHLVFSNLYLRAGELNGESVCGGSVCVLVGNI